MFNKLLTNRTLSTSNLKIGLTFNAVINQLLKCRIIAVSLHLDIFLRPSIIGISCFVVFINVLVSCLLVAVFFSLSFHVQISLFLF
eukprot:UN03715